MFYWESGSQRKSTEEHPRPRMFIPPTQLHFRLGVGTRDRRIAVLLQYHSPPATSQRPNREFIFVLT